MEMPENTINEPSWVSQNRMYFHHYACCLALKRVLRGGGTQVYNRELFICRIDGFYDSKTSNIASSPGQVL